MKRIEVPVLNKDYLPMVSKTHFLVFFGLLTLFNAFSVSGAIKISENSLQRLSFTWILDTLQYSSQQSKIANLSFKDANVDVDRGKGSYTVPAYSFFIGVPLSGEVQLTITPKRTRSIVLSEPLSQNSAITADNSADQPMFVDQWISQPKPAIFRGLRAQQYIIRPLHFIPQTKTFEVLEEATITISFPKSVFNGVPASVSGEYETMLSRTLINYEVARAWRPQKSLQKRTQKKIYPLLNSSSVLKFDIGDGHSDLNEGTIKENGLLKISGRQIKSFVPWCDSIVWVRLYASYKGEMPSNAPLIDSIDNNYVLKEVPLVRVDKNNNGFLDVDDYYITYVTGTSDWNYSEGTGSWLFGTNPYEDNRHYWIVVKRGTAGLSVEKFIQPSAVDTTLRTFENHLRVQSPSRKPFESKNDGGGYYYLPLEVGREWATIHLTYGRNSYVQTLPVQNPVSSAKDSIRIHGNFSQHDAKLNVLSDISVYYNGTLKVSSVDDSKWHSAGLSRPLSTQILFTSNNSEAWFDLLWYELKYEQYLSMSNQKKLLIYSSATNSNQPVAYLLDSMSTSERTWILRRDEINNTLSFIDTVASGSYTWSDTTNSGILYAVVATSGLDSLLDSRIVPISPSTKTVVEQISSPRSDSSGADYLVVTHPEFLVAAQKLVEHKSTMGRFIKPRFVSIEDVYSEFSGGNYDPAAIRDMLIYAQHHWAKVPDYLVLMGMGNYDYKWIKGKRKNFIPPYETPDFCVENFFVCLDPGENESSRPDMVVGRIPCTSGSEALAIVDKIIETEDPSRADFGAWRNRYLLVADDDRQVDEDPLYTKHSEYSEELGRIIADKQPAIDLHKLYLFEFPMNNFDKKPDATAALINQMNSGVAVVNYFGHGGYDVWADERVLSRENLSQLDNRGRYGLVASFSCDVSQFDSPDETRSCLSDLLIRLPKAGSVVTIGSTRVAGASDNQALANYFFVQLLESDSICSVGEAYFKSMLNNTAQKQYAILGDPSIKFINVTDSLTISFQNRQGITIDSIMALQQVTISGSVYSKKTGTFNATYGTSDSAFVYVGIYNPEVANKPKDGTPYNPGYTYFLPGNPVFIGQTKVKNGIFSLSALMPKNMAFDQSGIRVFAYSWTSNGKTSGLGFRGNLIFHGTDTTSSVSGDSSGPKISVYPLYSQSGKQTRALFGASTTLKLSLPAQLGISVSDNQGIDVVGSGPDEGLTMELVGVMNRTNINTKFIFNEGDYKSGNATFEFQKQAVKIGTYPLIIYARDLLGNFSRDTFTVQFLPEEKLTLEHVFNYPNPTRMKEGTRIYFHPSQTSSLLLDGVRISVKIYTLAGKLIRVLVRDKMGEENFIWWDGNDQIGTPLPPNIYLYRIIAEGKEIKTVKSKIMKIVVHPPL